jgi:thioredoxin
MIAGQETTDAVQYQCAVCGATNRILRARLRDDPLCDRCQRKIFPRERVVVVDASWRREVEQFPLPVLVEFWAPWCGPSRLLAPVLAAVARERAGRLKVGRTNVDENPVTTARYDVGSIPAMLLFSGPWLADRLVGVMPKARLDAWLSRFV